MTIPALWIKSFLTNILKITIQVSFSQCLSNSLKPPLKRLPLIMACNRSILSKKKPIWLIIRKSFMGIRKNLPIFSKISVLLRFILRKKSFELSRILIWSVMLLRPWVCSSCMTYRNKCVWKNLNIFKTLPLRKFFTHWRATGWTKWSKS